MRVSHTQLGPEARADGGIRGALVLFELLGGAGVFAEADQRTRAVAKPPSGRLEFAFSRAFPVGRAAYPAAFRALAAALAPGDASGADEPPDSDDAVLQFLLVADPGGGADFRDIGSAELRLRDVLAAGDVRDATLSVTDARGQPVGTFTVSLLGAAALQAAADDARLHARRALSAACGAGVSFVLRRLALAHWSV